MHEIQMGIEAKYDPLTSQVDATIHPITLFHHLATFAELTGAHVYVVHTSCSVQPLPSRPTWIRRVPKPKLAPSRKSEPPTIAGWITRAWPLLIG